MNKSLLSLASILGVAGVVFSAAPAQVSAASNVVPTGYSPITWVGEPGINSFIKAPQSVGYIDFVTVIDLTKNEIKLMSSPTPRIHEGPAVNPFRDALTQNWLFTRSMVESLKSANPKAKFIWNAPFFNVEMSATVLSLGLKSTDAQGAYITSGGRPGNDMAEERRMLIIDNKTNRAKIADFNEDVFVNEGDQAVEGFHPLGSPSSRAVQASRVYLGVRNEGKELVVYCSKSASKEEASSALINAGVPLEYQIQVDGGGSATCGYNLPGQYFVEPGRALPHIMGAIPLTAKGTIVINSLNVRTGPGTSNPAVRKLALGTTVTIFEEKNGWMRISDTEWVMSQYVKKVKALPYEAKVTINGLNVRTGPGTSNPAVRKLALDAMVTVQEEKNGWVRISDTEWISAQYVK